jgi:UDP-2-acetamido-3-amino-2,3-dideoxy-glucuronate N-acetyltransferase
MSDNYQVHETAVIDEPCSIGFGTKIWHFAHICASAEIGRNCVLGQNTMVAAGVSIGSNVKIQNNVSVYSGVTVEDDVFLGPSCVLTNVSNPRSQVVRRDIYETTLIRRGATIGANATIVPGVTIGRYAFIAAGAVVSRDVPDYANMRGVPARQTGWMSRHGHPLKPDAEGRLICPESGFEYAEDTDEGGKVLSCRSLDEESPLPEALQSGSEDYRSIQSRREG